MSWLQSMAREAIGFEIHLLAVALLWAIKTLTKKKKSLITMCINIPNLDVPQCLKQQKVLLEPIGNHWSLLMHASSWRALKLKSICLNKAV